MPAISELHRRSATDPAPLPQFRQLYSGPHGPAPAHSGPAGTNVSPPSTLKRQASQTPLPDESPAKKQSKWTPEEDNLTIELRGQGMKWDDIAKRLPGRSSISCRLRYQNYLEKRAIWDEEKKNKLARLYARYVLESGHMMASFFCFLCASSLVMGILQPWHFTHRCDTNSAKQKLTFLDNRFKDQMWQKVATEMGIPWRSAESMHWQLGEQEMSARANAPVFQLHPSATGTGMSSPSQVPVIPASAPHGFTPANAAQLMPNPPPMPPQLHQAPPPPMPQGPIHGYHHRTDSGSSAGGSAGRRRNSSFSRRRADARSRSSVPPQLGQPLPQIHPHSEEDLVSGARTAPVSDMTGPMKREGDGPSYMELYQRRRQDEEAAAAAIAGPPRSEPDLRSHDMRSPDRLSQRSATGSIKSLKRDAEDAERRSTMASPPQPSTPYERPASTVA